MEFYLDNEIFITHYTEQALKWCDEHLVLENPDYIKKIELGKWAENTQKYIVLYKIIGETLVLPFGTYENVYKTFKKQFASVHNKIAPILPRNYNSTINLFDYQKKAVETAIIKRNGVLVAPCGSGKTQIGLEIAARIGGRTLWLTHTQDLLVQSMTRAKQCFDLDETQFGTITEGKVNIGKTITFATVQTMCKIDLQKYKRCWDCVIVDECHKCVGSPTRVMMFYKVLSNLSARYKYGLTATPYRSDRLENTMFALLGDVFYAVPKEVAEERTCPVRVKFIYTKFMPDVDKITGTDGVLNYARLVDEIVNDERRTDVIVGEITKAAKQGAVIVLSDRLSHLAAMRNKVKNVRTATLSASNTKAQKEARRRMLTELNDGKIDVVFATYKLAKEGLDVPNLRTIVFATPQKDKATVIQSAGRVARKADGKEFGRVVDFVDDFSMFWGYANKRRGYYKSLNYQIEQ